jgi:heme iron utilization protein
MLSTDLAALKAHMAENPGAVIEQVAKERGVTQRVVVEAMPDSMRCFTPGDRFETTMQNIATWGDVTFIINTDDAIFEFTGPIPVGQLGHGYFNLMAPKGLHGHFRHQRCVSIAYVERTFNKKASAFVAFINVDGGIMFKVFLARDESGNLRAEQMEQFKKLSADATS